MRRQGVVGPPEIQNDVIDACVQLHGGYGQHEMSTRVARAWRDARVTKIWGQQQRDHGEELIGRDPVLAPAHPSGRRSQGVLCG